MQVTHHPKLKERPDPIIEFEKDMELYNFGIKGVDAVEIASSIIVKQKLLADPNGGVIDGVTLEVGNRIIFPMRKLVLHKRFILLEVMVPTRNVTLTEESYTASIGDVISIKFGARKQGVEYFWNGTKWLEGQKKDKVNTSFYSKHTTTMELH